MNKLTMAAVAALLVATSVPVVSAYAYPDAETQQSIDWQNLVAKANADRLAHVQNQGDVAAVKSNQATDAVTAPAIQAPAKQTTGAGRYNTMADYWADHS